MLSWTSAHFVYVSAFSKSFVWTGVLHSYILHTGHQKATTCLLTIAFRHMTLASKSAKFSVSAQKITQVHPQRLHILKSKDQLDGNIFSSLNCLRCRMAIHRWVYVTHNPLYIHIVHKASLVHLYKTIHNLLLFPLGFHTFNMEFTCTIVYTYFHSSFCLCIYKHELHVTYACTFFFSSFCCITAWKSLPKK